jgi:chromosome segregation ATPase
MSRDELAAERDQQAQQVSALDVTRISLQTEIGALREELASFVRTAVSSERALEESEVMAETLTRELAAVSLEYRLTKEELAFLQAELADEVASFKKERDLLIAAHTEELDILRDQHSDLESRYNRLVRPARSTVGRVVVEVRFWKDGAVRQYSLRESGGAEEIISESDLYQKLSVLKVKHADKLYTKVIPDDNSLTHGEAWGFTNKILNRFDYYYQN